MLKDFFSKKKKYATIPAERPKKDIPEAGSSMIKCPSCKKVFYGKDLKKNLFICSACGHHYSMSSYERIDSVIDKGTFEEFDQNMITEDPLEFPTYKEKLEQDRAKTKINEAVITGKGQINGNPTVIGVMDSRFRMGSMGSVVGEKITRAIEYAVEYKLPVILFSASGGARMQEGVLSLMQMAKTSSALKKLDRAGLLFISVMTHPTTGGVSASFASLGDYNFAEPGALIGFAGRRIIEQTIREDLPEDFQTAEFLLKHGQLDRVVYRHEMKEVLGKVLDLHK